MVTRWATWSALNRKLIRDVLAMKGQAAAIAAVIGAGIAMYVAYLSNYESLARARDAYYARQRLADVFVSAVRVPAGVAAELGRIDGVADIETRVVADVVLDVPGLSDPATGHLVSIPASGESRVNRIVLRRGRWPGRDRMDEVIASEAFIEAHGFDLGAIVHAVLNRRRRELTVVGVAISPEFLFSIRPGDLVPDAKRFGVFWIGEDALASAFDMTGAFNDVVVRLDQRASLPAVVAEIDRRLDRYGGRGAVPRALHFSNWTLENELRQLQTFGFVIPIIFLSVSAFVLNVALTRALALQRPQLASLKALGYTNREIGWHYLKWALVVAFGGAVLGVAGGVWMGSAMLGLYHQYFTFPNLSFYLPLSVVVGAVAISLGAAAAGAVFAVWKAVGIAPAEAMRPESPARYRVGVLERWWRPLRQSMALRMIVRHLERQPVRAMTTVLGMAFAGAILHVGLGLFASVDTLIAREFGMAQRQHMTLSLARPLSADAVHAIAALPGVLRVETQRMVPVRIRAGQHVRTLALTGLSRDAELTRPVDRSGRVIAAATEGLVISAVLGRALGVSAGDRVDVEVLEGRRTTSTLVVSALVDDVLGLAAYVEREALHRLLREGATVSGASVLIDAAEEATLSAALKAVPAVAGVANKRVFLGNFRRMLDENMGVMLTFNVVFAAIIAFGVVYNAARVSLSERSRELASLRVLGFTRAEISLMLVGELALLTLASLPVGAVIGTALTVWLVTAFDTEVFRFPIAIDPRTMAIASLVVVGAAAVSALVVRRKLDHLDLVAVLKLRE